MSIKILQPFEFNSRFPNFERDVVDSSSFDSGNMYTLSDDEKATLKDRYDSGHIVWDKNTKKHYRTDITIKTEEGQEEEYTFSFVALEPFAMTTADWVSMGSSYIPQAGEIIIYTDYDTEKGVNVPAFKVGDGVNKPEDLPFVAADSNGVVIGWDQIDDVVEYDSSEDLPTTGSKTVIYKIGSNYYRWDGESYVDMPYGIAFGYNQYSEISGGGGVSSDDKNFVDASATVSSGALNITTSGNSKRTYYVYTVSSTISSVVFNIPSADADIEHYVFLINGTSSPMTLSSITVSGIANSFYPDDIGEYTIPVGEGIEISVIKRGNYAIASVGGFYKK